MDDDLDVVVECSARDHRVDGNVAVTVCGPEDNPEIAFEFREVTVHTVVRVQLLLIGV